MNIVNTSDRLGWLLKALEAECDDVGFQRSKRIAHEVLNTSTGDIRRSVTTLVGRELRASAVVPAPDDSRFGFDTSADRRLAHQVPAEWSNEFGSTTTAEALLVWERLVPCSGPLESVAVLAGEDNVDCLGSWDLNLGELFGAFPAPVCSAPDIKITAIGQCTNEPLTLVLLRVKLGGSYGGCNAALHARFLCGDERTEPKRLELASTQRFALRISKSHPLKLELGMSTNGSS